MFMLKGRNHILHAPLSGSSFSMFVMHTMEKLIFHKVTTDFSIMINQERIGVLVQHLMYAAAVSKFQTRSLCCDLN